MSYKDTQLLLELYKSITNSKKVIAHGFSDRGVSSFRYTILDPHIKINQRANHGIFNDDYTTIVYNSIKKALAELLISLKDDKLNLKSFQTDFINELTANNTLVVYSFHKGNHFLEQAKTCFVEYSGDWNEVPLDIEQGTIIKEYHTTEQDFSLQKGVPYEEITPTIDKIDYQFKTYSLPKIEAIDALVEILEKTLLLHIKLCKSGEYTVNQMTAVKDNEIFVNLLKQYKLSEHNIQKFIDLTWSAVKFKWLPEYDNELKFLENLMREKFNR